MKQKLIKGIALLFFSFLICLPLILPFLRSGYFPSHDGEWAVVRQSEMYREIKDFQFPPRFSGYLNFEYGYPLFNFAYPLPYYLGLVLVVLKMGFVGSIKILFSASVVLSFLTMFYLSSSVWKNKWAGLTSAVFYVYAPYRIVDLYVRGSIGESLSFVLFPIILWAIKRIYEKKDLSGLVLTAIFFSMLITTHNIMTVIFGLLIGIILIVSVFKKQFEFVSKLILSLIFSLCLSAFFWIPAIFEKSLILLSKIPIADRNLYFVKPLELIIPKWGYGVPTDPNGFGYQIGLAHVFIFAVVIIIAGYGFFKKRPGQNSLALFLTMATLIISVLFFSITAVIWKAVPLLSEINYPWTLLAIVTFLISLTAGFLSTKGKTFLAVLLMLTIFAVVFSISHAKPADYVQREDSYYSTNQATTTSSNELMPVWVKKLPDKSFEQKVEVQSGKITNLKFNSRKISFVLNLTKPQAVRINTVYYPGWRLLVDGKNTKINYSNQQGVMEIKVNAGQHIISGNFSETPLRLMSDLISVFSIIGLFLLLIYNSILKFRK